MRNIEETCNRVAELYQKGTNGDSAILQVLQEILELPADDWNFENFFSDKPDEDLFLCRAIVAAAIGIYIDIITKEENKRLRSKEKGSIERLTNLFNAFLQATSGGKSEGLITFDPFSYDGGLQGDDLAENARKEYTQRLTSFQKAFQNKFGVLNCVEILGFNPWRYADYDEKTQDLISKGEWMQNCTDCMRFIVKEIWRRSKEDGKNPDLHCRLSKTPVLSGPRVSKLKLPAGDSFTIAGLFLDQHLSK